MAQRDGFEVGVKDLPTSFGTLELRLRRDGDDGVEMTLSGTLRRRPQRVVLKPPLAHTSQRTGSVYVYQNRGGRWTLRSLIKSPRGNSNFFGPNAADFGEDGRVLAVGESSEGSAATRIDGYRNDTSRPRSGAVWLY